MSGRDKDATWRSLATACRALDWSRRRALHELQNGWPYRTVPPGHAIDWRDPNVIRSFNVETSEVTLFTVAPPADGVVGLCSLTVGIELPTTEVPPVLTTAEWAVNTTRRLLEEGRMKEGASKAELARLLEVEAWKDVQDKKFDRTLKATYLENELSKWGIWHLRSLK